MLNYRLLSLLEINTTIGVRVAVRLKDNYESVEKAQMAEFHYSCSVKSRALASRKGGGNCMF